MGGRPQRSANSCWRQSTCPCQTCGKPFCFGVRPLAQHPLKLDSQSCGGACRAQPTEACVLLGRTGIGNLFELSFDASCASWHSCVIATSITQTSRPDLTLKRPIPPRSVRATVRPLQPSLDLPLTGAATPFFRLLSDLAARDKVNDLRFKTLIDLLEEPNNTTGLLALVQESLIRFKRILDQLAVKHHSGTICTECFLESYSTICT